MKTIPSPALGAAIACAFLLPSHPCPAQGTAAATLDAGRAVVVGFSSPTGDEAARFEETLESALVGEAEGAGLAVARASPVDPERSEPDAARAVASSSGARWILLASSSVQDSRVTWRATVYDGADGSLRGSDSFSSYAGLSALSLIEASAKNAILAAMRSIKAGDTPRMSVDYRLYFVSRDEGAEVSFGAPSPLSQETSPFMAGTVADGGLESPYFPFMAGDSLAISVEKDGFWPRRFSVKLPESPSPIAIPALFQKTSWAYGGNYGTGRMLGAAASARWYPIPDEIYIGAENAFWAAYDFSSGSRPVLHDELRLGVAAYLFFNPAARFRSSVGLGLSGVGTFFTVRGLEAPAAFDLCAEPLFFTLEWHFPAWAIVFESRYPYSLGLSTGLLPRGWLSLENNGPLFFSFGVLVKR
jgi:hypothetical protein